MKRFTIIFSILLVLSCAGVLAYVAASPEFVPPDALIAEGEDPDAPIWDMTMDEVLAELAAQGLIEDPSSAQIVSSSGICSDTRRVSGAEFSWWNLENLEEDSQEFIAYKSLKSEGIIDIYGSGYIVSYVHNGPFALWLDRYEGDPDALERAFKAIGQSGGASEISLNTPVWSKTLEELAAYLESEGFIDTSTKKELGTMSDKKKVWRYKDVDLYWWDLERLEEDEFEYQEYYEFAENGVKTYTEGSGVTVTLEINGPFGLRYSSYEGEDTEGLIAAFQTFGH